MCRVRNIVVRPSPRFCRNNLAMVQAHRLAFGWSRIGAENGMLLYEASAAFCGGRNSPRDTTRIICTIIEPLERNH
jgi:hypothetical protein